MRFIHTADIHLGAVCEKDNLVNGERNREIFETFCNIINVAKNENVDLLIISGDLFHRQPLLKELKEVNQLFCSIENTNIIIIAGNHDYIKRESYYNTFKWNKNVTFIKQKNMERVDFNDLNTSIYGFSYYSKEITETLYDDVHPKDESRINILVAHGGDETHIPFSKATMLKSGFDYIALGHIHKYSEIIKGRAVYPGSPEPLDVNETGNHGYIIGDITKQKCNLQFIDVSKRKYIHWSFDVSGIKSNIKLLEEIRKMVTYDNNLYKIIFTGKSEIDIDYEMISKIKNVVKVVDNSEVKYNIDQLYEENKNGLIGMYISQTRNEEPSEINKKSMDYAMKALLYKQKGNI